MLLSLRASKYKDWAIAVYYQDYLGNAKIIRRELCDHFIVVPERVGVGMARLKLLSAIPEYKYYGHIDDDMYLLDQTHYLPMLDFLDQNPQVGHVMSAWARYEGALSKMISNMKNQYHKQILIYTGGGQFYRNDVAKLYRGQPFNIGKKDDETIWTLVAYLAGYENYVYEGSVALHKTLQKGGNRLHQQCLPVDAYIGFPNFIKYRILANGDWGIPMDRDILPNAKQIHRKNYEEKFGGLELTIPEVRILG